MRYALSTNWCNRRLESGEAIVEAAARLGFDELELGFHTTRLQAEEIRRHLKEMPVGSVHAFAPVPISAPMGYPELYALASFGREERELARVQVAKNIEFAASMGASALVLHAGRAPFSGLFTIMDSARLGAILKKAGNQTDDRHYQRALIAARRRRRRRGRGLLKRLRPVLETLLPILERHQVTLALENLPYLEGFPDETELEVVRSWGLGEWVRGWFDTGHDRVRRSHGWVTGALPNAAAAENFAGMHLNDVHDFEDEHLPPGQGKVDFAALAPFAAKLAHRVFEPNSGVSEAELGAALDYVKKLWGKGAQQ